MNLKCPNCNTVFEVDESHYSALLTQVKNAEFEAELKSRLKEMEIISNAREEARKLALQGEMEKNLAAKDVAIGSLRQEIERLKGIVANNEATARAQKADADAELTRRLTRLETEKDKEIASLERRLESLGARHELALVEERNKASEELHRRDSAISELTSRLEAQSLQSQKRELELKEQHKTLLRAKDEEIERYKDMKSRLSTKMLGESLEQHCQNAFNMARSHGGFATAYFEKDNDASGGTKGDFIFRDFIDGRECISIMFEMKNEDDRTATKHKNEDFFAKLHKDRCDKGCEYAVLVSTLEADSDFYNEGIVDVSYRYEKMYVIRPQFFISVISLLSQSAKRGAETIVSLRRELAVAKAQTIDVTKFEERRDRFAAEFMKFVNAHRKKHDEAILAIDKAIDDAEKQIERLRKVKALFDAGTQKLNRAGEVIENDFTIKKLTHGNPTMKQKFTEARRNSLPSPDDSDTLPTD